ncbi:MAG: hypothetical protein JXR94_11060 [Candidatus Hydrogenedentes bacterium]|nr:hypothetical protein [Candidatus Hydrogenedentota bacterium]
MKRVLSLVVLALIVLPACKKEEAPPPPPPPPPPAPPTAEELYQGAIGTIEATLIPENADSPGKVRAALQGIQGELRAKQNGETALLKIANDLKDRQKQAFANEKWDMVIVVSEGVEFFEPGNGRTARYLERALAEKNRPRVTVKGFYTDQETGAVIVFMDCYLPEQKKTEQVEARVGDEFFDLKLERIIGRNSAVELTYLRTGNKYQVKGPRTAS